MVAGPGRAPEPFLDAILADLGNPFPFDLDALGKRRLASVLVEMYRQKGTAGWGQDPDYGGELGEAAAPASS